MKIFFGILVVILVIFGVWRILLGPSQLKSQPEIFSVPQLRGDFDISDQLKEQKLISSAWGFRILLNLLAHGKEIQSGGYRLNKNFNAWQVLKKITGKPDLLWVTIYGCRRKEEIGETLAATLGWSEEELKLWDTVYTNSKPEYFEGVYYPDTYLIPIDESGEQVAQRLIARFNEKFAPLADRFVAKNIKWTTGLKIASLIAREAAGPQDMKLISGIIWNRLDQGIKLEIDATMQYTSGQAGSWWRSIDLAEKRKDSPYNTYLYKGLPPTPICSPGIDTIEAVLKPEETECLFYLHDRNREIHCAKTYPEHQANIRRYWL